MSIRSFIAIELDQAIKGKLAQDAERTAGASSGWINCEK